tara:strand:- start:1803 stop:2384 length:582 start_codon:yes stop_codon:yes gene_type:complete
MLENKARVVDNYFPDWLVDRVSLDCVNMPVTYTNSPYKDFNKARFFGNLLMVDNNWMERLPPWWFLDYFNLCVYNDICKEYNLTNCHRVLLNGQLPGQNGCNHCDSDYEEYLTIIYMASGTSGDTVLVNSRDEDVQRVPFKRGRMVIFNSSIWHRGEAPTEGYRITLGAVYPLKPIHELTKVMSPNQLPNTLK